MFDHHEHIIDTSTKYKSKTIYLIQNGHPERMCEFQTYKKITKDDVIKEAQKRWGYGKYKNVRLFTIEAVQYFADDLQYLRDGEKLYISKGEEFDSNSNFGEYQIIRSLGQGGFGHVSLVRNIITNESAAIKVVKADRLSNSSDVDMIFREAQNLKTLNHPHIVKILNCYTLRDMKVVIVMEYLEGGELRQLLKKKQRFSQKQAKKYLKQIVSAICYCHRNGVIHRDLKLQNILVKDENVVKVADFGISGVANRFNPEVDWGTLRYMSPEVLSKRQKVNTPAVDVWSCGIMLYFMIFGEYPFTGISSTQIKQTIINDQVSFGKNIPISESCKELIREMLVKDPKKRINMIDIQDHPWMLKSESLMFLPSPKEENDNEENALKTFKRSGQFNKNLNIAVPKRLEKEKNQLAEELESYKMNRKLFKSEGKKFPGLKHRESLNKNLIESHCSVLMTPISRFNYGGQDTPQLRRKKDLQASWK